MHAGEFVLEYGELVDLAKLFKHGPQVGFFKIAWNLPDEQLDGLGLLMNLRRRWRRRSGRSRASTVLLVAVVVGLDPSLLLLMLLVLLESLQTQVRVVR